MSKKLIYLIIAIYFLSMGAVAKIIEVAPASARMTTMIVGGGAPAAAGCTAANDSAIFEATTEASYDNSNLTDTSSIGAQLVFGASSYTITRYVLWTGTNLSDPGAEITGALYNDSSDTVGTIRADTSVVINEDQIANSDPIYTTFFLGTPKTGQTGTLWVQFTGTGTAYLQTGLSNVGTTWGVYDSGTYVDNKPGRIDVWGCSE